MLINQCNVIALETVQHFKLLARTPGEIVFAMACHPERFVALGGIPYEITNVVHGSNDPQFSFAEAMGRKVYRASRLFEMVTRNGPVMLEGHQWFAAVPPPEMAVPFHKNGVTVWAIFQRGENIETHAPMREGNAIVYVFDRWTKTQPKL